MKERTESKPGDPGQTTGPDHSAGADQSETDQPAGTDQDMDLDQISGDKNSGDDTLISADTGDDSRIMLSTASVFILGILLISLSFQSGKLRTDRYHDK